MFPNPWGFPFGMGDRERRRRGRRSSESSRSRDRRRRSDRGRSRRSRTPERSQPSTLPPPPPASQSIHLPAPEPGYIWQQVPAVSMNAPTSAQTQALPQHTHTSTWAPKENWKSGWSSYRPKQQWNKWKKETSSWGQQDTSHDIKEATPEEIETAKLRKASEEKGQEAHDVPDDGDYLNALWASAKESARTDECRPKSATELVAAGLLQPWWNMTWKEIVPHFPNTGEYKAFLQEAGQGTPDLVADRLATVLAAFRHFKRPLEGDSPLSGRVGPELLRFEVPGQQIIVLSCRIPFPEYEANEACAHFAAMSHGTSFSAAIGIAQYGGIAVSHNKEDAFPSFGFSARGTLTSFTKDSMVSAVTKTAARAKSLGGVMILVEATLPGPTPSAEGGGEYLHATCRDSGSVRCGDHFLIAPRHAILRGIAAGWPK